MRHCGKSGGAAATPRMHAGFTFATGRLRRCSIVARRHRSGRKRSSHRRRTDHAAMELQAVHARLEAPDAACRTTCVRHCGDRGLAWQVAPILPRPRHRPSWSGSASRGAHGRADRRAGGAIASTARRCGRAGRPGPARRMGGRRAAGCAARAAVAAVEVQDGSASPATSACSRPRCSRCCAMHANRGRRPGLGRGRRRARWRHPAPARP